MKKVYLDYASTTPLDSRVQKAMSPFWIKNFGNPSSLYQSGRTAKKALDEAREKVAKILNASPQEIIFTGSGTESDAMAILGAMRGNFINDKQKGHCIVTALEHHAVLFNAQELEKEGFEVTYLGVDGDGLIDLKKLKEAIRSTTVLVSVIYVNNEIGTIEPLKDIAKAIKEVREQREKQGSKTPILFHSDACQAAAYLSLNLKDLGVDLFTINGSKIYGPKGTGVLYIKRGVQINSLWRGGGQENYLRSGTENVSGIVGLAKALELVQKNKNKENKRLMALRDYFIREIFKSIDRVFLNGPASPKGQSFGGHPTLRIPNNINISFLGLDGEALMIYLDKYGIEVSTGSACDSSSASPSHVVSAIGRAPEFSRSAIRFSLGKYTTKKEIDYVLKILPKVVKTL